MNRIPIALLVFAMPALALAAPPTAQTTLKEAKIVLDELEVVPEKGIPIALLNNAEAIVIIPNTVKAGFGVGGRFGHGVAIIKDKDGWGDIRFLTLGGASVGFQVGVEVSDVVLVFKNRKGLDRILDGKTKLTLGGDVSVAAGPVGRKASVSTDGALKSEIWSYSRSRGLFAGVSLDGAVLIADTDKNNDFIKNANAEDLKAADELKLKIAAMLVGNEPGVIVERAPVLTTVPTQIPDAPIPVQVEKPRFPLLKKIFRRR